MARCAVVCLLAVVIMAVAPSVGAGCYSCYYTEIGPVSAGSSSCQQPTDTTPTNSCSGKCSKIYVSAENYLYVYRGCNSVCAEGDYSYGGHTGKSMCCEGDLCNSGPALTASLVVAALATVGAVLRHF